MAYSPLNLIDGSDLSAANVGHIESGLLQHDTDIALKQDKLVTYMFTSGSYTLATASATLIPYTTKTLLGSAADASLFSVSNGNITISKAGIYLVDLGVLFPSMTAGIYLELSGFIGASQTLIQASPALADQTPFSCITIVSATAGQVLTCKAMQKSGGNVTIQGGSYTFINRLIITRLQ